MSVPSAFLEQMFTRKLFAFAGNTLLVYDYLITFSLEVAYVWSAPWSVVKALFLVNRYGNLIGQTFLMLEETGYLSHNSQRFCAAFELYLACFAVFSGESIRLLVLMRAGAILGVRHGIAVLANTLYVLCAAVILAVSLYLLWDIKYFYFEYLHETGVCFAPVPPEAWPLFLLPLSLDSFVVVVVGCSLFRLSKWSDCYSPSRLIRLLARDTFMFYVAALFNILFFIAFWTVYRSDPRNAIPTVFSYPFLSVIGQRLVLNLRRFRSRPHSTHELSREVHRQMAAMGSTRDGGPGHTLDLELDDLGVDDGAEDLEQVIFALGTPSQSEGAEVPRSRAEVHYENESWGEHRRPKGRF